MTSDDADTELAEWQDELAWMLVRIGGVTRAEAIDVVRQKYTPEDAMRRMLLLHETPYYWAMSHFHGRDEPRWHTRPGAWPPPPLWKEYERDKAQGAWTPIDAS